MLMLVGFWRRGWKQIKEQINILKMVLIAHKEDLSWQIEFSKWDHNKLVKRLYLWRKDLKKPRDGLCRIEGSAWQLSTKCLSSLILESSMVVVCFSAGVCSGTGETPKCCYELRKGYCETTKGITLTIYYSFKNKSQKIEIVVNIVGSLP